MVRGAETTEEGTAVKINNEFYNILVGRLYVPMKTGGKFWKDQMFYLWRFYWTEVAAGTRFARFRFLSIHPRKSDLTKGEMCTRNIYF